MQASFGTKFPPPPFCLKTMWRPTCYSLLLGPTQSGKTVLMRNLLIVNRFRLRTCVAFNLTEDSNHNYAPLLDKMFVHTELTEQAMERLIKRGKIVTAMDENPPGCNDKKTFAIFDDVEKHPVMKLPITSYLVKQARNDGIGTAMLYQNLMQCPKDLRAQPEFVMFQVQNSYKEIYEQFLSSVDRTQFQEHCNRICAFFGTGVIWTKDPTGQKFYYLRAQPLDKLPNLRLDLGTQFLFAELFRLPPKKRKKLDGSKMHGADYLTCQIDVPMMSDKISTRRKRQ